MRPQATTTIRPLSPRLASLERSLSAKKDDTISLELPASPRILRKHEKGSPDNKECLSIPSLAFPFFPRPSLIPVIESGYMHRDSTRKTAGRHTGSRMEVNKKTKKDDCRQVKGVGAGILSSDSGMRDSKPSRIPRLNTNDQNNNALKKSPEKDGNASLNSSDSTDPEPPSAHSINGEKSLDIISEASPRESIVRDLTGEDMERRTLLSSMPKKLKEEAVLRSLAANLKLASNTGKVFTPRRQHLEGRHSADSGRESFGPDHEEEARPKLYRFDSISSVSSTGSTVRGSANNSQVQRPWSLQMVAEAIKKRRRTAATEGKKSLNELVSLYKLRDILC